MKILLFSGGIDSTAIAWWRRPERLFFVDYGQLAAAGELRAAQSIAKDIGLPLDVRQISLRSFGHGAMADGEILNAQAPEFWPYRNQMLLTLAGMAYAADNVESLIIGSVAGDERHPDGTDAFRSTINRIFEVQGGPKVEAPASKLSTEQLIEKSAVPLSVLGWTFSCHRGEWACGGCNGCIKHNQVMDNTTLTRSSR